MPRSASPSPVFEKVNMHMLNRSCVAPMLLVFTPALPLGQGKGGGGGGGGGEPTSHLRPVMVGYSNIYGTSHDYDNDQHTWPCGTP
jgi:hypothetical protein